MVPRPGKNCQEQFLTSKRWPEGENTRMYFIIERSSMPNNSSAKFRNKKAPHLRGFV
jgi:hypothetical protein